MFPHTPILLAPHGLMISQLNWHQVVYSFQLICTFPLLISLLYPIQLLKSCWLIHLTLIMVFNYSLTFLPNHLEFFIAAWFWFIISLLTTLILLWSCFPKISNSIQTDLFDVVDFVWLAKHLVLSKYARIKVPAQFVSFIWLRVIFFIVLPCASYCEMNPFSTFFGLLDLLIVLIWECNIIQNFNFLVNSHYILYILVYKSNACISRTLFLKPKIQLF